jgi:ubiquinone/menaquinone biosynthesis C-methylase UbiE
MGISMTKEDIQTLGFYKKNAKQYSHHAFIQQEVEIREIFMNMLPHKGTILDFGCGPGYDAYAFSKKKFLVTALDAVNEFSEIARNKFKLELRIECFSQFRDINLYNGIWGECSSNCVINILT